MTRALIVIDVQNDFCPGGNLAVTDGDAVVTPINAMMADFDAVVLTQDWHPADHLSFASNHNAEPMTTTQMPYGTQVLWPDHCIQGTDGAARDRGITDLTFAGLALDFCVAWSALDAIKEEFTASVQVSACRAIDFDGSLDNALTNMKNAGVTLIDA